MVKVGKMLECDMVSSLPSSTMSARFGLQQLVNMVCATGCNTYVSCFKKSSLYLSGFRNVRRVWGTRLNSTAERRSMASLGTLLRGLATGRWEFYARSPRRTHALPDRLGKHTDESLPNFYL